MFYFICSNISFLSKDFKKILFVGSILYILVHALLFSKKMSNNSSLNKYAHYIYYIWGIDITVSGLYSIFASKSINTIEEKETMDDEIDNEDKNLILKRLDEIEILPKAAEKPSIFIKKTTEEQVIPDTEIPQYEPAK